MKVASAVTASLVVAVTSASKHSVEKCTKSVGEVLTAGASNDGAKACAKEAGITLGATTVSAEDVKKATHAASCKKWWHALVKDVNVIEPSCKFASLDGSGETESTADFSMKYKDFLALGQKAAAAAGKSAPAAVDPAALQTCLTSVTSIMTKAKTNKGAHACSKESGVPLDATTMSEADVKKAAGADACKTWWNHIVKSVQAVAPPCAFPNFDGSGSTLQTDAFKMQYQEFMEIGLKAARANGAITNATDKPVTTTAAAATGSSIEQCTASVGAILTTAQTNDGAKTCAKDAGLSLTATSVSAADIKKAAKTKSCKTWWHKVEADIKAVKPPCTFANIDGSGTTVSTDKFSMKYEAFLDLGAKMAAANGTTANAAAAKKDAPKKDASQSTPTTTAKKSNAVVTALSVSAMAAVVAMYV
ncbi:Aste57867_20363 [Aphanomyces stellatus]|uniref:Aste57867_20363 protein n=1 Tax=Aphanomyces stellatus TaxID=120398 RepID=A0A485LEY7_9STRA|nr:hypothetical protein As57867_020297 [Aphanomyces stellatus]VFT97050.1 Aste57867_20363 [Aphanomyces stellatus]